MRRISFVAWMNPGWDVGDTALMHKNVFVGTPKRRGDHVPILIGDAPVVVYGWTVDGRGSATDFLEKFWNQTLISASFAKGALIGSVHIFTTTIPSNFFGNKVPTKRVLYEVACIQLEGYLII